MKNQFLKIAGIKLLAASLIISLIVGPAAAVIAVDGSEGAIETIAAPGAVVAIGPDAIESIITPPISETYQDIVDKVSDPERAAALKEALAPIAAVAGEIEATKTDAVRMNLATGEEQKFVDLLRSADSRQSLKPEEKLPASSLNHQSFKSAAADAGAVGAALLGPGAAAAADAATPPQPKRRVLVVLSSQHELLLKDGTNHPTGFYLDELMVPANRLKQEGVELTFANPLGNHAVMDARSDKASYFKDDQEYRQLRDICKQLGLCGDGVEGTKNLKSLEQVLADGIEQYDAVFIPGGHAPMIDLWKDSHLGAILRHFHEMSKLTAIICHGPIALLSTLAEPKKFIAALEKQDMAAMAELKKDWPYKDYPLTVFTTAEEPPNMALNFYPDQALAAAGANVQSAPPKTSHVVAHKELITGQNPVSAEALAEAFVQALFPPAATR